MHAVRTAWGAARMTAVRLPAKQVRQSVNCRGRRRAGPAGTFHPPACACGVPALWAALLLSCRLWCCECACNPCARNSRNCRHAVAGVRLQARACHAMPCHAPPAGLLYAGSLWLSNSSYLYLSVSFIQMTKSLMPGLVYASGVMLGTEKYSQGVTLNMLLIAFGVVICAIGEANLVFSGLVQQLTALVFEVRSCSGTGGGRSGAHAQPATSSCRRMGQLRWACYPSAAACPPSPPHTHRAGAKQ